MAALAHKSHEFEHRSWGGDTLHGPAHTNIAEDSAARGRYAMLGHLQGPAHHFQPAMQANRSMATIDFGHAAPQPHIASNALANNNISATLSISAGQLALAGSDVRLNPGALSVGDRSATLSADTLGSAGAGMSTTGPNGEMLNYVAAGPTTITKNDRNTLNASSQVGLQLDDASKLKLAAQPQPGLPAPGMDHEAPQPRGALRGLTSMLDGIGNGIADPGGAMAGHYAGPAAGRKVSPLQARMNHWSRSATPMFV